MSLLIVIFITAYVVDICREHISGKLSHLCDHDCCETDRTEDRTSEAL